MRPVNKDNPPKDSNGQEITFKKHQHARRYLIDTIGDYCSYCERKIPSMLEVEHIEPQLSHPDLELKWSNFLLSCRQCNAIKKAQEGNYFWADKDNTYVVFVYDESGIVKVSQHIIDSQEKIKAIDTIKLLGLNKKPPKNDTNTWKEASDRRFEQRVQAFIDAKKHAKNYSIASLETRNFMLPLIKTTVLGGGFWSIWMRAFESFPEVQKELINSFKGTRKEFFQNILNS